MLMPPAATACQVCAEVPGTQVAVPKPTVGTSQLEAEIHLILHSIKQFDGVQRKASFILDVPFDYDKWGLTSHDRLVN